MGAWGYGPFDNDEALDFLGEASGSGPLERRGLIANALIAVLAPAAAPQPQTAPEQTRRRWGRRSRPSAGHEDPVTLEVGVAVAAAALVAARLGAPTDPAAREWLDQNPFEADGELRTLAAKAIARAFLQTDDNDWYAAWDEAGHLDDVRAALRPYLAVLG